MTDDTLHSGDPDELLLTELRRVAALLDPMPDRLVQAGRESLTWRSVDAELAALLSDSAMEDERAALVRSTAGLRAVAFESSALTIELDVLVDGPRRTLVGQLVPAAIEVVELLELGQPDRGGDVGEIVLVAEMKNFVKPTAGFAVAFPGVAAEAVQAEAAHALGKLGVDGGGLDRHVAFRPPQL